MKDGRIIRGASPRPQRRGRPSAPNQGPSPCDDEGSPWAKTAALGSPWGKHRPRRVLSPSPTRRSALATAATRRRSALAMQLAATIIAAAVLVGLGHRLDSGMQRSPTAGMLNGKPQPRHWQVTALQWYDATLAGAAYGLTALVCNRVSPTHARWLMLVSAPLIAVPAYSIGSMNGAGSYYDRHAQCMSHPCLKHV